MDKKPTKFSKDILKLELINDMRISIISIVLALAVSGILISLIGESPIKAYSALFTGAFGSINSIANTLSRSVPLIFTGLSVAIAFRCGLFNIGAEGQLTIGAFVSTMVAIYLHNFPVYLIIPIMMITGMLAGAILASFAGLLKAKYGINEVIVTIMTNYLAIYFVSYYVNGPFKAGSGVSQTELIPEGVELMKLIPRTQLSSALFIAIIVAILSYFLLWKTSIGFEIRAVGENKNAANTAGISVYKNYILAMAISGAIASLAGITAILGIHHRYIENFSPSYGFTGIAVAVLAKNHPVGVIFTALLFGVLEAGALRMNRVTSVSSELVVAIEGLIIFFIAMPEIVKFFSLNRKEKSNGNH